MSCTGARHDCRQQTRWKWYLGIRHRLAGACNQGLERIAAQHPAGVFRLAVRAGAQAARGQGDDLDVPVLPHLLAITAKSKAALFGDALRMRMSVKTSEDIRWLTFGRSSRGRDFFASMWIRFPFRVSSTASTILSICDTPAPARRGACWSHCTCDTSCAAVKLQTEPPLCPTNHAETLERPGVLIACM